MQQRARIDLDKLQEKLDATSEKLVRAHRALRREELRGWRSCTAPGSPNKLYDGKTSVYDPAQQSFGGTIRLLEHSRCVPDIIRFSNDLCCNGDIRALREASSTRVKPTLVAHRVKKGVERDGINEQEAQEIAALRPPLRKVGEDVGADVVQVAVAQRLAEVRAWGSGPECPWSCLPSPR